MEQATHEQQTLCWKCQRAAGPLDQRCSWSLDFKPVDGWEAKPTVKFYNDLNGVHETHSFLVKRCPRFLLDRKPEFSDAAAEWKARSDAHNKAVRGKMRDLLRKDFKRYFGIVEDQLSFYEKAVIRVRHRETQLSWLQVADKTNLSIDYAKFLEKRAIEKLSDKLKGEGYESSSC